MLSAQAKSDSYNVKSDVYEPDVTGNVRSDKVSVVFRSLYKDPTKATQTELSDILLEFQEVTYFRSGGHPNVPDGFQDFLGNTRVPNGGEVELEIEIVRSEAKLKSPLKEIAFGGGEGNIRMNAQVKIYGKDMIGNRVVTELTVPIEAKDW